MFVSYTHERSLSGGVQHLISPRWWNERTVFGIELRATQSSYVFQNFIWNHIELLRKSLHLLEGRVLESYGIGRGQVVDSSGDSKKKKKKIFRFPNMLGISWTVSVVASQERIFSYLLIAVIGFLTCDVVFIWYSLCLCPNSFSLSSLMLLSFNTTRLATDKIS